MATCAMVMMLSSCSDNNLSELLPEQDVVCTPMTFTVSQEPLADETRIYYIERAEQIYNFYMVAELQNEIFGHQYFFQGQNKEYLSEKDIYWPEDSREELSFYAINCDYDNNFLHDAVEVYDEDLDDYITTPLNNAVDIPIKIFDSQIDLVAAYTKISENRTVNGVVPLSFKHILGVVGIYVKGEETADYPDEEYTIEDAWFEPVIQGEAYRTYHFDTNTWTSSTKSGDEGEIPYFPYMHNPITIDGTSYQELLDIMQGQAAAPEPGDSYKFLIPGNYFLYVSYSYDADGDGTTYGPSSEEGKKCTITITQGKKNRINLTLPALDAVPRTW